MPFSEMPDDWDHSPDEYLTGRGLVGFRDVSGVRWGIEPPKDNDWSGVRSSAHYDQWLGASCSTRVGRDAVESLMAALEASVSAEARRRASLPKRERRRLERQDAERRRLNLHPIADVIEDAEDALEAMQTRPTSADPYDVMDAAERRVFWFVNDVAVAAEQVNRLVAEAPKHDTELRRVAADLAELLAQTRLPDSSCRVVPKAELAALRSRLARVQQRVAVLIVIAGRTGDRRLRSQLVEVARRLDLAACFLTDAGAVSAGDWPAGAACHGPPAARLVAQPIRRHGPPVAAGRVTAARMRAGRSPQAT